MASGSSHKRARSSRDDHDEPESKRSRHGDEKERSRHGESKHSGRGRSRSRSKSRSRSRSRSRPRSRERERTHDRPSGHDRDRKHDHDRERDSHDSSRSKHKSRERTKERSHERGEKERKHREEVEMDDLPPGWRAIKSSSGEIFYYNSKTKARQWKKPGVWSVNEDLNEAVKLLAEERTKSMNKTGDEVDLTSLKEQKYTPAVVVMPAQMFNGLSMNDDELTKLKSIGIEIDVPQDDGSKKDDTEKEQIFRCACVKCSKGAIDPRVAMTSGLLSCSYSSCNSAAGCKSSALDSFFLDCFF